MHALTCPKCHGQMRAYERNRVTIDQCTECRGVFLDRGELERLVDADLSWQREQPWVNRREYDDYYGGHGSHGSHGYGHSKRRKSFLEQLLD
ncbi:MAG: zf-TFIIB domain-containing protein [Carbonactinosporaceae bacterium]